MKHTTVTIQQAFDRAGITLRRPCEMDPKHRPGHRVKRPGGEWRVLCPDCQRTEARVE